MKQFLTVFIIIVIIISCDSNHRADNSSVLNSKNLIAYIENPSQKGGNGLLWGRIVILDIDTQRKYYLKEKESYINNPVWLPNNKKLMYFTETEGYTDSDFPFGFKLGVDIFLFNTERQTNQILFPNLEKTKQKFYMMTHEINGTNDSNIFIIPQIRNIYQIKAPNYEISRIVELDSSYFIHNIDVSPNGKFVMMNVDNSSIKNIKQRHELLFYSIKDSLLNRISTCYISINGNGGWDVLSENYIYPDWENILNFNVITNSIDTLSIHVKNPSNIAYTKDGNIIGLTKKVKGDFKPSEVFLYSQNDKKIIWLTNDNIYKECFSILF